MAITWGAVWRILLPSGSLCGAGRRGQPHQCTSRHPAGGLGSQGLSSPPVLFPRQQTTPRPTMGKWIWWLQKSLAQHCCCVALGESVLSLGLVTRTKRDLRPGDHPGHNRVGVRMSVSRLKRPHLLGFYLYELSKTMGRSVVAKGWGRVDRV